MSGSNNEGQSLKITLPNPNRAARERDNRDTRDREGYPFPYSSPNSKLSNTLPGPSQLLNSQPRAESPNSFLNSNNSLNSSPYSNYPQYQSSSFSSHSPHSKPISPSAPSSPSSSPRTSPTINPQHANPYTLPGLNLGHGSHSASPSPSKNYMDRNNQGPYSNPISFVSSGSGSFSPPSPTPPRALKTTTTLTNSGEFPVSRDQFSSSPTPFVSPSHSSRSHNNKLSSPPASPKHDGFSQHSSPYPSSHYQQQNRYQYMDAPPSPVRVLGATPVLPPSPNPVAAASIPSPQSSPKINPPTPSSPKLPAAVPSFHAAVPPSLPASITPTMMSMGDDYDEEVNYGRFI